MPGAPSLAFATMGYHRATQLPARDSFLYELSANDPLILSIIPVIIVAVVLLACYVPARPASKVDPVIALRCE